MALNNLNNLNSGDSSMAPLLNEDIRLKRLTKEILEACLSREAVTKDAQELKAFLNAADCLTIHLQILGVAAALQTGRLFTTLGEVDDFIRSGELDMDHAVDVLQACIKFFMVGWHARGAVEDSETLERMVRTSL